MDKETLILNIEKACAARGVRPTPAFIAAGIDKNLLVDIRRGRSPSVTKVAALAAYLGVSTSDLVGDRRPGAEEDEARLLALFDDLNEEGRERLIEYAEDLTASGRYIKSDPNELDKKTVG